MPPIPRRSHPAQKIRITRQNRLRRLPDRRAVLMKRKLIQYQVPRNPRAVRGFAASTLIRPVFPWARIRTSIRMF